MEKAVDYLREKGLAAGGEEGGPASRRRAWSTPTSTATGASAS